MYQVGNRIIVDDKMQCGYEYTLSEPIGENFLPGFEPHFTPAEMLSLGVFEGKYCNDCKNEFPDEWFANALVSDQPNPDLNYFGIKSRQSLSYWKSKGWIYGPDPRGWFQWYCRYYFGRRIVEVDAVQVKRWRGFTRHAGQITANCEPGDCSCRPRQRQALLQWSHNPFI